jgi:hypothetical protein
MDEIPLEAPPKPQAKNPDLPDAWEKPDDNDEVQDAVTIPKRNHITTRSWQLGDHLPPPEVTAKGRTWSPEAEDREDTGSMLPWRENTNLDVEDSPEYDTLKADSSSLLPDQYPLLFLIIREPDEYRGKVLSAPMDGIIGRGRDADMQWRDARMSRRHARIRLASAPKGADTPLVYLISPESARNGLWINGKLCQSDMALQENDEITMGDTVFVVKILD